MQHVIKQIFHFCEQQTSFFAVNLLSYKWLTAPTSFIKKDTKKVKLKI